MNEKNLHELINRYEANFYTINNAENNEIFKWKTVKHFRDVWFSAEAATMPFSQMFHEARKEATYILDNSRVSPTSGVVKLAEVFPQEIESLFRDVLFADDGGDIEKRQEGMDTFIAKFEELRQKEFSRCWKYKQERHAASCYLSFIAPEQNYIYRYSEAEEFAQYIEFGKDIGSGEDFHLDRYYEMCDIVVEALRQHTSLLEKHFKLIEGNDQYYKDESLHLLVFDLMYCCRYMNFYNGLEHASKKASTKAYQLEQLREKEAQERAAKIAAVEEQIHELQVELEQYEDVSLIGVEVTQSKEGVGTVISQNGNMIKVQFPATTKTYAIHRKYSQRPTFEDDAEIVEIFSDMADKTAQIESLRKSLKALGV